MRSNDFDKIAVVYDRLAKLIFGKSINESQKHFLPLIPSHSTVLILGGGSGWILPEIMKERPGVYVCYIDASKGMIDLARKRIQSRSILFIHGTENDIPAQQFDVVLTHFYLDLFPPDSLRAVIAKIKTTLLPGSSWIVTDFLNDAWWKTLMLTVMYRFFRWTCRIESNRLPDWNKALFESGGRKKNWKFFYGRFIETAVFQF
ncbi:MAG TPA: class I SAM-dependent methyltransferase [Cyclobacteriaceae bacterium]|nr:class I SAM-dependent methyltransferase [Cyclobacteriaceae bacterium]